MGTTPKTVIQRGDEPEKMVTKRWRPPKRWQPQEGGDPKEMMTPNVPTPKDGDPKEVMITRGW